MACLRVSFLTCITSRRFRLLCRPVPVRAGLWGLSRRGLRRAQEVVVAIVLLPLLLCVAIGVLPLLPLRFWQLAGMCASAAAVRWWFLVGAKRYSRRGF